VKEEKPDVCIIKRSTVVKAPGMKFGYVHGIFSLPYSKSVRKLTYYMQALNV